MIPPAGSPTIGAGAAELRPRPGPAAAKALKDRRTGVVREVQSARADGGIGRRGSLGRFSGRRRFGLEGAGSVGDRSAARAEPGDSVPFFSLRGSGLKSHAW